MIKVVTVEEMRAIEQAGDAAGVPYAAMMEHAGTALAERILEVAASSEAPPRISILVGPGNNGGDALVAGKLIAATHQYSVTAYLYRQRPVNDRVFLAALEAGLTVVDTSSDTTFASLRENIAACDILIDGLLGIGARLPITGRMAEMMQAVSTAFSNGEKKQPPPIIVRPDHPNSAKPKRHAPYVIAVDCPSGLDCDSGEIDPLTIHADETMTFEAVKIGQTIFPGAASCGVLVVGSIGLPDDLPARNDIPLDMPVMADIQTMLPPQQLNAHKGSSGKILHVTGSGSYYGAVAFAAKSSYYAGAGLVAVATPDSVVPVVASLVPEATWTPLEQQDGTITPDAIDRLRIATYNAMLVGPGIGHSDSTSAFMQRLLDHPALRHMPLIIDADGLNNLTDIDRWWERIPADTILTPHPGEMARLTGLSRQEVNARRVDLAKEYAEKWRCIVLLKGAYTVITTPDGSTTILPFAEPSLATAGTGDILAGLISGLLVQGMTPYEAAVAGGYVHGLAGRQAATVTGTRRSVTAQTVLNCVPKAFRLLENERR